MGSDFVGAVIGHIAHENASLGRCLHIHIVHPNAVADNQLASAHLLNDLTGQGTTVRENGIGIP